jgi:hypothetical protein
MSTYSLEMYRDGPGHLTRRKIGVMRIEATDDTGAVARANALLAADEEELAALVSARHPISRPKYDAVRLVKEVWSKDIDA